MKIHHLFIGISLLAIGCIAAKKINYDEPRKVPKQQLVPPGTVWLRDSTFIDETEVRNLDYLEFLYWTRNYDSANYVKMLPDTLCWRQSGVYNEPFVMYYLRHPAYRDYPVVGVSYEQAGAFCKWRAERINQFVYLQVHREIKHITVDSIYRIKAPRYVECHLPSREEWEYAAAAGLSPLFNYGYISLSDPENRPVSNTYESWFMRSHTVTGYRDEHCLYLTSQDPTQPVATGSPNRFGIYNMLGNVSEIIQDSSFKGLNYATTLDGATLKEHPETYQRTDTVNFPGEYDYHFTFRYADVQPWLGFRCICVVKQRPKK